MQNKIITIVFFEVSLLYDIDNSIWKLVPILNNIKLEELVIYMLLVLNKQLHLLY